MSNYDIERIKNLLGTHEDFPKKVCKNLYIKIMAMLSLHNMNM